MQATYWKNISIAQQGNYFDASVYFEKCYKNFPNGIYQAQS